MDSIEDIKQQIRDFYGEPLASALLAQVERLVPYMQDAEKSLAELFDPRQYRKDKNFIPTLEQKEKLKKRLTEHDILKIITDYADRVEAEVPKRSAEMPLKIAAGDLVDVIKMSIPHFAKRDKSGPETPDNYGRRVFTGQHDRPGSKPGRY